MRKLSIIYISIILVLFFFGYYYFRLDDAFIFYKYAKNIAEGNGYVFNVGEKVNATTSPLYTLILALLYWMTKPFFTDSFVVLGNLISIFSIILILYSIKNIFNDAERFHWFAIIFLSMPLLKFGFGMETFLNLALIVYSIYLYTSNKLILASIFIGLSVLARLDSILYAGIIFLYYIVSNKKLPPFLPTLTFLLITVPWFVFSKIYFNSFLPTTINVKLSQNDFGMFGNGLIFFTGSVRVIPGTYLTVITLSVFLLFSIIYLIKKRITISSNHGLFLLKIWSILLFLVYGFVLNAPPYQWYYTPFSIILSIIFALVLKQFLKSNFAKIIITILLIFSACVLPIKNFIEGYNPKYIYYTEAVNWLNANTTKGTTVGVDEIGIIGCNYKNGKLVDALGLITPDVVPHLSKKDFNWYLLNYSPDYIVNDYPYVQKHAGGEEKTFREKYKVVKVFESRGQKIAIYKRANSDS